jgi:hypothetical protein
LRTTRFSNSLTQQTNFSSIFASILEREKTEGGLIKLAEASSMDKALRKHVSHEAEVDGVAFRATSRQG